MKTLWKAAKAQLSQGSLYTPSISLTWGAPKQGVLVARWGFDLLCFCLYALLLGLWSSHLSDTCLHRPHLLLQELFQGSRSAHAGEAKSTTPSRVLRSGKRIPAGGSARQLTAGLTETAETDQGVGAFKAGDQCSMRLPDKAANTSRGAKLSAMGQQADSAVLQDSTTFLHRLQCLTQSCYCREPAGAGLAGLRVR